MRASRSAQQSASAENPDLGTSRIKAAKAHTKAARLSCSCRRATTIQLVPQDLPHEHTHTPLVDGDAQMARGEWRHQTRETPDWLYWRDCKPQIGLTCYSESSTGRKNDLLREARVDSQANSDRAMRLWTFAGQSEPEEKFVSESTVFERRHAVLHGCAKLRDRGIVSRLVFVRILP